MKTASWFTWQGPGRIGISLGTPRFGVPAGYRLYRPLNPGRDFLHAPLAEYQPRYMALLAGLDPRKTWDELHQLAAGAEPILLCFERPPLHANNFCHRRMVADWFKAELGEEVPEYNATIHR
jgi:hypothetical protein